MAQTLSTELNTDPDRTHCGDDIADAIRRPSRVNLRRLTYYDSAKEDGYNAREEGHANLSDVIADSQRGVRASRHTRDRGPQTVALVAHRRHAGRTKFQATLTPRVHRGDPSSPTARVCATTGEA